MSIEDHDKIDGMGLDSSTGKPVLFISDHLTWEDFEHHFGSLEKKIRAYIDFATSGQLRAAFPEASKSDVAIELYHEHTPPAEAVELLDQVSGQLSKMGYEFSYANLPDDY